MRVALITNAPSPYRNLVFDKCAEELGDDFRVIFCVDREPNRKWKIPACNASHAILHSKFRKRGDGLNYVYLSPSVLLHLRRFDPDVVVTTGFSPTFLYAQAFCRWRNVPHVYMTDGTLASEQGLSALHRLLRKWSFKQTRAFIGASHGSDALFRSYGVTDDHMFRSRLCVNNLLYESTREFHDRPIDILVSGSLDKRKNTPFALEVASRLRSSVRDVNIVFAGQGTLRQWAEDEAKRRSLKATFLGYLQQDELAQLYGRAKLLLLPSLVDAWGVVANEACAAGTPVLCSVNCGVANDLIQDGKSGYVLELDVELWAERAARLLTDEMQWAAASQNCRGAVAEFNAAAAAEGLLEACRSALTLHA